MFEAAFNESLTKEELKGNQKNLDVAPPYGKLTGADFKKLRAGKKKIDKEGNEFTGKLAAAKAAGDSSFEIDGKTVEVKEKKSMSPYAVGMAAAKKQAGVTKHHDLPKSVVKKGHEIGKKVAKQMHKENFGLDAEARRRAAPAPAPEPTPEPSDADVWAKSLDKGTEPGDFDAAQNPALKLDTEGVQKAREWIKKLEDMATFINGMDENSLNSQINALEMRNSIPFKGIVRRKEKQITDIAEKLRALAELFKTVVTGSQKKIHDATAR
jgi:hypothetical protein